MESLKQFVSFLLLCAILAIPRAILIARAHSETIDEEYHLLRGVEFLQRDAGLITRELNDPPLGAAISTLPLWIMGADSHREPAGTVLYGQRYPVETGRLAVALWKAVLFVWFLGLVFIWCRSLFGVRAAWLVGALLLFEPTLAGHLHLGTLDVLATSAILLACWSGWRFFERPTRLRVIGCALATAAALLVKHTAIIIPLVLAVYALSWGWKEGRLGRALLLLLGLGGMTLLAMWVLLLFDVSAIRGGMALPGGLYIQSVRHALGHAAAGDDAFLWGEMRRGGWWYYFPAVAWYKVPIGVMVVILCGIVSIAWRRPRWSELALLVPLALYWAFITAQRVNIGWRHALPGYVLLIMWAGRAVSELSIASPPLMRWATRICWLTALSVSIDALRYHPDYLAYTNWPRDRVYESISDSNVDWNQGLAQARDWIDAHPQIIKGRTVWLRTFRGTNRAAAHYLGDRVTHIRASRFAPNHGLLVISPAALVGLNEAGDAYTFLRAQKPIAIIGHALLVYDLDAQSSKNAP